MLSRIVFVEWQIVHASGDGLAAMRVTQKALVAAEKASFERGPSNGVLGDGDRADPAKGQRLVRARTVTDAAMRELDAAIAAAPQTRQTRMAAASLLRAHAQLSAGRAAVDRVAALPRKRRDASLVMGAVGAMFDVIPIVMDTSKQLSVDAEHAYPQLTYTLAAARLASELREYAGRLGSEFTAALTAGTPLAPAQEQGALALRGRIDQLHDLIAGRLAADGDPRILAAGRRMDARYFGDDLRFVDEVRRTGDAHRPYGMDTAQFAARYVPPMGTIVDLRDALIAAAIGRASAAHASAQRTLVVMCTLGGAAFVVVCALVLALRRRVLQPLATTARIITEIASGNLETVVPAVRREDEIGAVLSAVEALRKTSIEKAALEVERQHLIDELLLSSTTDYLTGLMNRRAFVQTAEQQLASARRYGWPLALIIFDIDHFKHVNDRYGHEAGDLVIASVAATALAAFRAGDVVCRYGGEEFAALAPHCAAVEAVALTERMRATLAAMPIVLHDGSTIRVTASFGVVVGPSVDVELHGLIRAADEALYRAKDEGRNRVVIGTTDARFAS
jgi:diguanylate cyclase (GGDEF)-like protein